jgi:transcriptional regulator with XRE-family HTH domain
MYLYATSVNDIGEWRRLNGLSRNQLGAKLAVSAATVRRWENGLTRPKKALAHRLLEMMRFDAAEHLALTKLLIQQSRSFSALFDFADVRLLCASQGLREVWPNFCSMMDLPFLELLTNDARRLMTNPGFLRKVRHGEILGISGIADRPISAETDPPFRHKWLALFRAYGPQIVAELSYEPCQASEEPGLRALIRFGANRFERIEQDF